MLIRKRPDAAYITGAVVRHFIAKNYYPADILIKAADIGIVTVPLHAAFNLKHEKAKHYADLLDKGLQALISPENIHR